MKNYIIALNSDSSKMLSVEYSFGPLCLSDNMDMALEFDSKEAAEDLINSIKSFMMKKDGLSWAEVNELHVNV